MRTVYSISKLGHAVYSDGCGWCLRKNGQMLAFCDSRTVLEDVLNFSRIRRVPVEEALSEFDRYDMLILG